MQKLIQIWGETQVGKTTLLSSALFAEPEALPWIDRARSSDILTKLQQHWQQLRMNQLAPGTAEDLVDTQLFLHPNPADLESIVLRDMRGGDVRKLKEVEIHQRIEQADGILFLVAWDGQDLVRQIHAMETVIAHFHQPFRFLCLHKAEQALNPTRDAQAWQGQGGWWRHYQPWKDYCRLLERFAEDAILPTSAYGYDPHHPERPACLLGEFGNYLPYNVQPINVARPLAWFMKSWTGL